MSTLLDDIAAATKGKGLLTIRERGLISIQMRFDRNRGLK